MRFAINYSHPAAHLFQAGAIQFDYFKTPNWPDMVAEAQALAPVAVHFDLQAGAGKLSETDWQAIDSLLAGTVTRYVSVHLSPRRKHYPELADLENPADEETSTAYRRLVAACLADVQAVAARFGPERVIVENVPYRPGGKTLRAGVEPAFISRLLAETGCGLLLDISHARISAASLGISADDYLDRLPTSRLRELHFTGLHQTGDRLQDHLPILPTDWPWLDLALQRIASGAWARPWMLALEYGGVGGPFTDNTDPAVIAEQVPQVFARVQGIG